MITKTEYRLKIGDQLLKAMNEIDNAVGLMNQLYHENYKEIDQVLSAKSELKKVLNAKFDQSAIKNNK